MLEKAWKASCCIEGLSPEARGGKDLEGPRQQVCRHSVSMVLVSGNPEGRAISMAEGSVTLLLSFRIC